ncbi:MAG: secretin N-terminal domain-containing protein [Fuerstiella sp.]
MTFSDSPPLIKKALDRPSGTASSKLRVLPYRGESARTLLDSAQKFWPHDDRIEIVPSPVDDGDARPFEREIDSEQLRHPKPPRQGSSSDAVTLTGNDEAHNRPLDSDSLVHRTDSSVKPSAHLPTVLVTTADKDGRRSTASIGVPAIPADGTARIRVPLTPRGILIHSDDPDALKRFEEHLKLISGSNEESDRQLAVFYLKYAEIDDANALLRQLLSEDSLSASGSPAGLARLSLPQSMMDVTGGLDNLWIYDSATVIPDKRLNRFFVYGSEANLTTIEDHLRVIDRENSIAQLNTHGTPRMITLYHARAEAVATIIRDTYTGRIVSTAKKKMQRQQPGI